MSSLPLSKDDDVVVAAAATTDDEDDDAKLEKTNSKCHLPCDETGGDTSSVASTSFSVTSTTLDDDKSSLIMTTMENEVKEPVQVFGNRSIEIFFGNLKTFHNFYEMLCEKGVGVAGISGESRKAKLKPESIKKLVLVGHPMTSFSGINLFAKLVEAWVTNCCIPEAKWSDFNGLIHLHKFYIYNCKLHKIEPFYFQNLRVLWLAGNNLTSLNFLGQGLVSLNELNVARNEITCLLEEQLIKSVNLRRLNLSGNPLCILQDVQAIKVLPTLQTLHLVDPLYGKCPVATLCDSRAMLLSVLTKITSLDGKTVTPSEMVQIQEYVTSRCIHYYVNSVRGLSSHVAVRKSVMSSTSKQMETIGTRLLDLVSLAAKYRRTISSVEVVPIFTNAKNLMKDQLMKIENRMMKLKEWKEVTTKRLETIMQISSWEQEAEKWMKWIEFQSYGNTQCRISHSVHGPTISDGGSLCGIMHELLSSLACPGLWPQGNMLKLETVMVVRDKGMEAGMERVFYDYFALRDEPKFVPPTPDPVEMKEPSIKSSQFSSTSHGTTTVTMSPQFPYCPPPSIASKPVTSYTTPDYKPPPPIYPFPESVPGLPERAQPLFMFLICPQTFANNPLLYLQRILLEKSRYYKDIRVTNCLWLASHNNKPVDSSYSVVIIVKVLEECLQPINLDRRGCSVITRHSPDCSTFGVKRPLAFAPAYIVNISFTQENKQAIWHKSIPDDDDVLIPAETALTSLLSKIQAHGHPPVTRPGRSKNQPHLKRVGDGFHADLSSVQLNITQDGNYEILDTVHHDKSCNNNTSSPVPFELHHVSKLLGRDASPFLTSLDLSGNRLGLTVGLENMPTLKKLNLSYNNLTTLTGLQKLPNLIELKAGWNHLRFLQSNVSTLAWVSPRLMTLEILPNPFQDVRDLSHIPLLFGRVLPLLHRVDIWTAPFSAPPSSVPFAPPVQLGSLGSFAHDALAEYWVGTAYNYNDLANKCLTDLTDLTTMPPFPPGFSGTGIDLNLSHNYLNSTSLQNSTICTSDEWRNNLTILQLQENMIANLDWVMGHVFPNCQILNLSMNQLDQVEHLPVSFPNIKHLHLSGNPLPCEPNVLSSFRLLDQLITLDCTSTPVSSHPEYGSIIIKYLPNLKILDGSTKASWDLADATDKLGGTLTPDWLEEKMGPRDWGSLSQLSLANCGIQKISLPPQSLSKLLSLDLQDNSLTNFSNLSSLPGLRVLCVSHNNISSLGGSPCPVCYTHTAQSQAVNAQKLRARKSNTSPNFYEWNGKTVNGLPATQSMNKGTGFDSFGMPIAHPGTKILPCHVRNDIRNTGAVAWGLNSADSVNKIEPPGSSSPPSTPLSPSNRKLLSKPVFPRLEVLIMAHNGLNTASDLHLHSMQNLQTIILNCNNLTSLNGLENLPCVRAIVLDHNRIRDVPYNSLVGCKSLRYLHLEHNRLTSLPRLPHLTNLTALYLAYNKIQGLTDLNSLPGTGITELSMVGNPLATRSDYRLNVAARLSQLTTLDGKDLANERFKLSELARFQGSTTNVMRDYAVNHHHHHHHDPFLYRSDKPDSSNNNNNNNLQQGAQTEFGLRVKPLSTNLSNNSPRSSLQYSAFKSAKRYNNNNVHQDL